MPDYERDEGFTLLCRTHVYEDVTIELLNYDEDMIRSGLPIQQAVVEVVSDRRRHPRHAPRGAPAGGADEISFFPGQYLDIAIPGTESTRSFSMANISSRESGQLEFVIKVYPDGLFSGFLDTKLAVGDRLDVTGPFGVFTLREGREGDVIFVGGGAGMAPILCLLRSMVERGITRKATYYYGARTRADLCFEEELRALEQPAAGLPLCARAVGGDRGGRLGRRGRLRHRRGAARTRATSRTSTLTCAVPHRWWKRPWRCSPSWVRPRNGSTSTSSRQLVTRNPTQ